MYNPGAACNSAGRARKQSAKRGSAAVKLLIPETESNDRLKTFGKGLLSSLAVRRRVSHRCFGAATAYPVRAQKNYQENKEAKWTWDQGAKKVPKGRVIGCSEETACVTAENASLAVLSNFCCQKFAPLEAKPELPWKMTCSFLLSAY